MSNFLKNLFILLTTHLVTAFSALGIGFVAGLIAYAGIDSWAEEQKGKDFKTNDTESPLEK